MSGTSYVPVSIKNLVFLSAVGRTARNWKEIIHFPGHLMFYAPCTTEKEVGSGPGAPFIINPGTPQALMIVVPAGMGEHK